MLSLNSGCIFAEESKKGVDSERDGERKINLTKRTVII